MAISEQSADTAVQVSALRKTFRVKGRPIEALTGVDLTVGAGEIFGFLGPNGAGKTTTLRILTTLIPPDSGEVTVAGVDVRRHPREVRRLIGYVRQAGGTDAEATGRENLELQARLYGMRARDAERRTKELIELFDLGLFADRIARTYSGGQRRRLEVALGIIHRPQVLFLDEPTTGLDPQNRANLWGQLRGLRDAGNTIFLTTHYLEEADQLSDHVAIIDHGRIVAAGPPEELKHRHPASVLLTLAPGTDLQAAAAALRRAPLVQHAEVEATRIRANLAETTGGLAGMLDTLRTQEVGLIGVSLTEPSLDDVFLHQTGRSLRDRGDEAVTEDAA